MLLDEPFSGIDPIAVYEVQKIVRRLRDRGLGILSPTTMFAKRSSWWIAATSSTGARSCVKATPNSSRTIPRPARFTWGRNSTCEPARVSIPQPTVVATGHAAATAPLKPCRRLPVVTVQEFYRRHEQALGLKLVAGQRGLRRVIREPTVNRPGLLLAGFARCFARRRVQVIGSVETHYLHSLPEETRRQRYRELLSPGVPASCSVAATGPTAAFRVAAETAGVPVLRCPLVTMKFINQATLLLEGMFERHEIVMGSMVDIWALACSSVARAASARASAC